MAPEPGAPAGRFSLVVSPTIALHWAEAAPLLGAQPGFTECLLPSGRAPRAGETFRSEPHARTPEAIAATRGDAF